MKKSALFGAFTVLVAALVATVALHESFATQSPGEARREWRERRRTKVGNAGDESAEAQVKLDQFAQPRSAPGVVLPGAYRTRSRR